MVHLGLFTGIPMFEVGSKFDDSKFGSFAGSIKVGSVRSKFGKDEVQTALYFPYLKFGPFFEPTHWE